jgi:putative transposase
MTPRRPNSLRLQRYNYSQAGVYFVTVVVKDRKHVFGEIVDETMMLNEAGNIVQGVWKSLAKQYPVTLDEFIVMPNHVHGIIAIQDDVTMNNTNNSLTNVGVGLAQPQKPIMFNDKPKTNLRPTQNESIANDATRVGLKYPDNHSQTSLLPKDGKRPTPTENHGLSDVIRFFKSLSAKRVNILYKTPGRPVWQTGFYDRVIRDDEELNAIRTYLQNNPSRWAEKNL